MEDAAQRGNCQTGRLAEPSRGQFQSGGNSGQITEMIDGKDQAKIKLRNHIHVLSVSPVLPIDPAMYGVTRQ
jgi:hypothetical protein